MKRHPEEQAAYDTWQDARKAEQIFAGRWGWSTNDPERDTEWTRLTNATVEARRALVTVQKRVGTYPDTSNLC